MWIYAVQSLAFSKFLVDFASLDSIITNKMKLVELCQILIQQLSAERMKKSAACRSCMGVPELQLSLISALPLSAVASHFFQTI